MLGPVALFGIALVCNNDVRDAFLGGRGGHPLGIEFVCFRGWAETVVRSPSCWPEAKIIVALGFKLTSESS